MKNKNFVFTIIFSIALLSMFPSHSNAKTPFNADTVEVKSKSSVAATTTNVSASTSSTKANSATKKTIKKGTVRADVLNVRKGPWNDILGTLKKNAKVNIVGTLGDWYKIEYNGKEAYVHSKWIDAGGEKRDYPDAGIVSDCHWLNVRRAPGGDILGQFKTGTKVEILGVVGDWYKIKYNGNEAFVAKRYIDTPSSSSKTAEKKPATKTPAFKNFDGQVNASIGLNIRDGAWGNIVGAVPNGTKLKVIGKSGDWYKIKYKGTTRYVHSDYIKKSNSSSSTNTTKNTTITRSSQPTGNLQKNIVRSANALVGSTSFRGSEVSGGRLACAQVVTTALKNAGALNKVHLNCRSAIADLKSKGWKEVSVPPFREGDVITWKTYDYTGDGIKDHDTHIGIIVKKGNTFKAMNNSSSLRTPRLTDPYCIGPVSRVLRKM